MTKAYYITNWQEDRENAETRKYVDLLWFRNKVKLMGEGLGHTLAAPDNRGPHLYGMFKLIEQVAAGGRLEQRGWLFRNGSPMDAQRIANLLRLPVADVAEALKFFSTPPMNWLEEREWPGDSPAKTQASPSGGRLPGGSPTKTGESPKQQETGGRITASGEHTNIRTYESEREKKGEFLDPKEARSQQTAQFAAARARLQNLEAVPEGERDDAERHEIKKMRRLISDIQKKQAANDFTPVKEKSK